MGKATASLFRSSSSGAQRKRNLDTTTTTLHQQSRQTEREQAPGFAGPGIFIACAADYRHLRSENYYHVSGNSQRLAGSKTQTSLAGKRHRPQRQPPTTPVSEATPRPFLGSKMPLSICEYEMALMSCCTSNLVSPNWSVKLEWQEDQHHALISGLGLFHTKIRSFSFSSSFLS